LKVAQFRSMEKKQREKKKWQGERMRCGWAQKSREKSRVRVEESGEEARKIKEMSVWPFFYIKKKKLLKTLWFQGYCIS